MRDALHYVFNRWRAIKVMPAECHFPASRSCAPVPEGTAGDGFSKRLATRSSQEPRAQERPSASSRSPFRAFALLLAAIFACEASGSEARARDGCPGSLPELYKKVSPAVVSITSTPVNPYRVGEPMGRIAGSGFLFDAAGLMLTNAHLVFGQQTISVTLNDGQVVPAQLVGADPVLDVAVVRLSRSTGERFPVVKLAEYDHALVGEEVLAIGNPLGLQQTLTHGIISAVNRSLPNGPFAVTAPMIQTDAPINPGNSGGPLVNVCGQVLGITRGMLPSAQNIGFAIPINLAKELIPKLLADGRVIRPWLGIDGQLVSEPLKALLRAPLVDGLMVEVVAPGSPAERAGLRGGQLDLVIDGNPLLVGGDIITAINGVAVKAPDELSRALKDLRVGDTVHLTVARANEPFYVESVLVERPLLPDDVVAPKGATPTASEVGRQGKTWTSPIRVGL